MSPVHLRHNHYNSMAFPLQPQHNSHTTPSQHTHGYNYDTLRTRVHAHMHTQACAEEEAHDLLADVLALSRASPSCWVA